MGKRKSLTTDDLLRRQEGPQKRLKTSLRRVSPSSSQASDIGSDSETSVGGNPPINTADLEDDEDTDAGEVEDDDSDDEDKTTLREDSRNDPSSSRFTIKPRTDHEPVPRPSPSTSFSGLGISTSLQAALTSMSIRNPTEVQAACIPPLLQGN